MTVYLHNIVRKDAGVVERDGLENRFPMEIGTRVRIPLFPPSRAEAREEMLRLT